MSTWASRGACHPCRPEWPAGCASCACLLPVEHDDLNGGARLDGREIQRVRGLVDDVGLALEELVDGRELLDREGRRLVVHGDDDQAGAELVDDARGLI